MDTVERILENLWHVLLELSFWLLLGTLIAGLIHVLLPGGFIRRHLGPRRWWNVFKAVAVGVPMPLCSCGVIPAALGLKKDGASDGASVGFLISTPQTGVDSILVSANFLGLPFALFKVLAALLSGLVGGLLVNSFDRSAAAAPAPPENCPHCGTAQQPDSPHRHRSWKDIFGFGFVDLLGDVYRWLVLGVVVAALISTFVPAGGLKDAVWAQGLSGMLLMLLVSLPMYVCTTASVPLAAALVTAGMSPGAALVLLMAGPTTNVATLGAVYRGFGTRIVAIYLGTVVVMSLALGWLFDGVLAAASDTSRHIHPMPNWLATAAAVLLICLIGAFACRDLKKCFRPVPPQPTAQQEH